jgi:ribokinase
MSVLVVGSANRDMIVRVQALPRAGETVAGRDPVWHFGGKGANQAVAAARCGAHVQFVAAFGDDEGGRLYREYLQAQGIDLSGAVSTKDASTGTAVIFVDDAAQNMIVVSAGANGRCTVENLPHLDEALAACTMVVLQYEIPMATIERVILNANRLGKPVLLNPSPLNAALDVGRLNIEYLIVNQVELETLSGSSDCGDEVTAIAAAQRLRAGGRIANVIVTRGGDSTLLVNADGNTAVPAHPVTPVDTVGAGDTFAGAFAAALDEGRSPGDAVRFANTAAAISTQKLGAQESMPTRAEVERAMGAR